MPESLPNNISQTDYDTAKAELSRGRAFTKEFDWHENVKFPIQKTEPNFTPKKWRGITVELAAYIVGRATPPNDERDEPFYIAQGSTPTGPRLVRDPAVAGDAPSVQTLTRKSIGRVVAFHESLDREASVRVQAQAAAYEEDFDAIWNDLLDAIKSDAKTAAEFGLATAPGLTAFGLATPGAAVKAITDLLPSFQSNQVGGDIRVFDTDFVEWFRSENTTNWSARKFTLHTSRLSSSQLSGLDSDEQPGWYLAEWIIRLSTEARSYGTIALLDRNSSLLDPDRRLASAAALRLAQGESVAAIATDLGVLESDVTLAAAGLANLDPREMRDLVVAGTASEVALLRRRLSGPIG
ncbi:MAG: hypothetical protein ACF8PN_10415 [Phycisphaerales bacterium]